MSNEYKNNHYVPEWYQRKFIPIDQTNKELYRLDLNPTIKIDLKGNAYIGKSVRRPGFRYTFAEEDLYTLELGNFRLKDIEQLFFGEIDSKGKKGVEYFENFIHPSVNDKGFENIINYMSSQKIRTRKGLDWLTTQLKITDKNLILEMMMQWKRLYGAIWAESIWQIADAKNSETKFIISDHPVTVYNRNCPPSSFRCLGSSDPDIRLQGTHTIFPLSLNKVLILTNRSWVRNPYQSPTNVRPNPIFFRNTIFSFMDIQTLRFLSEQEVREINYIIKMRAYKYVAAANKEWLYPEKFINTKWSKFGQGYLLMPDPRPEHIGGGVTMGFNDGTSISIDEYGRFPSDKDYSKESDSMEEANSLYKFKGEFSRLFGPYRRGRTYQGTKIDDERESDEMHEYYLKQENR